MKALNPEVVMYRVAHHILGILLTAAVLVPAPRARERDERGLSQSTENAILLAGAVAVAGIVITVITAFVQSRLPR